LVSSNSSINVAFFILAIVLSVLLWFTASDYPFGIFKLFYQCDISYFGHCVVCPSLIYSFRLPRKHNGQNKACHIDIRVWKYQMGNMKL
jgi:hypothetical protein